MKIDLHCFYTLLLSFSILAVNAVPNLSHRVLSTFYRTYVSPQAFTNDNLSITLADNFWEIAQKLGVEVVRYANQTLEDEASKFAVPLETLQELKQAVRNLTDSAGVLQVVDLPSQENLTKRGLNDQKLNMTHFYERLEEEVGKIIDQLMEEFQEPLPEDETERYKRRKAVVERGLNLTEDCLVVVYGELGISEVEARERFGHIKPTFERVLLIIVNIIDHHPRIMRTILFAVTTWILPIRVVRIILRAFGLGPAIRGRRIATRWLQKFLFDEVMEAEIWMKMLWAAKGKARWSIKIILAAVLRFVKDLGFRVLEALLNNDNVAL